MCIGTCKAQTFNFECSEEIEWTENNGIYSSTEFPGYSYTIQELYLPDHIWISDITVPTGATELNGWTEVYESTLHVKTRSAIAGAN